jgi:capping protein beta
MSADHATKIKAALNIMRRMAPANTEASLAGLVALCPEQADELLQRVDQPLKVATDPDTGKKYVLCDLNRDGDSYRSPWSNKYFPPLDDGFSPSAELRKLELECNYVFDAYRQLYFEGGYASVYLWDLEGKNFAGCFLVQKDVDNVRGLTAGCWNSIHVIEAIEGKGGNWEYKLTTTVIVSMQVKNDEVGVVDLSGHMTKQDSKVVKLDADRPHIKNIGGLVEEMELKMRNSIEGIYIQKTRTVLSGMRTINDKPKQSAVFTAALAQAVSQHGSTRVQDSEK